MALLVLTGTTACGGTGPLGRGPAATVNGHDISADEVEELVEAQVAYLEVSGEAAERRRAEAEATADPTAEPVMSAEDLAANIDGQISQFRGTGVDALSVEGAAQVLTSLISDELSRQALASAGGEVTEEQRAAAREEIDGQLTEAGVEEDQAPQVLVDRAIEQTALEAALEATAPDEVRDQPVVSDDEYTAELQALYEEQVGDFTQLCLNVVLAADEADADEARARIDDGESIADVAEDLSTEGRERAVDGAGACLATADAEAVLGDGARGAQIGDVFGPVDSGAGDGSFVVAEVDRLDVPAFEDLRPQLEQANPNTQGQDVIDAALAAYVADLIAEAVEDADVTVDPRYGTWDAGSPATAGGPGLPAQVVPPEDPGATTTTTSPLTGADGAGTPPVPAGS